MTGSRVKTGKRVLHPIAWVFVLGLGGLLSGEAGARVFKMKQENLGTYFKGDYTPSALGSTPYSLSSGAGTVFTAPGVQYHTGLEVGFFYVYRALTLRLGFENLRAQPLDNVIGTDAGGTDLLAIKSSLVSFAPIFHLDFNLYETDTTRFYLGVGAAQIKLKSVLDYEFTSAGLTAFPGVANYREEVQAELISGVLSLGYEFLLTDATTTVIELGYRNQKALALVQQKAINQNVDGNAIAVGDTALNSDATPRTLDTSGAFLGLAFRFYIDII